MYDYLVVGAGFFGSVFAYEANKKGKKILVIDKRKHIGGNAFTMPIVGINVHQYGAHIFHTNNKTIWDYINQFAEFNNYIKSPFINDDRINSYFNDKYQGIPIGGYTQIFEKLLDGIEVLLEVSFFQDQKLLLKSCKKIIYTGSIDEYYNYCYGKLEYRGLSFYTEVLNNKSFQDNAIVNYTDSITPYTRIVEHKHFEFGTQDKTVITYEYPQTCSRGNEPYYPVNDEKNNRLYTRYAKLAQKDSKVIFGGRLGTYKYYDMDKVISEALKLAKIELQ